MKKKWFDYLWILSLCYLTLGFFNILFAWLGLLCFFIPLIISLVWGTKGYCNRYCGRGQLFSLLGGRFGLSRKRDVPRWMKSRWFRYGFLILRVLFLFFRFLRRNFIRELGLHIVDFFLRNLLIILLGIIPSCGGADCSSSYKYHKSG